MHGRSSLQSFMIHENSTKGGMEGEANSISKSTYSLHLKLNQLPPVSPDFHQTLQGESAGEYL